jgi:GNAT superfamily N-acetyltransferase
VLIPEPVRALAIHPWRELPPSPDVDYIDLDGARLGINRWPTAQMVFPLGGGPGDVAAAVDAARAIARERGKETLAWWVAPEHDPLAPALEACGLVNRDTPGFEAVENTMALTVEPDGEPVEGLEVGTVESFDDYLEVSHVIETSFDMPHLSEEALRARYDDYLATRHLGATVCARIDGRIVASGYAAFAPAGVNLFGGAVLPEARGRGIYRALVHARWAIALERGTPALTVQAGRQSRPICERLGFALVEPVRVFVDELAA